MTDGKVTVAGCVRRIRKNILKAGCEGRVHCDYGELMKAFDAIEAAHVRKVAELKKAYDHAVAADVRHAIEVEHLRREIGERNGERKGILKANESFAADNTRLRGEIAEKDAEIAKLRELVGELAGEIEILTKCTSCNDKCRLRECCTAYRRRLLVAKAREVVK